MRNFRRLLLGLVLVSLAGCASQSFFYNHALSFRNQPAHYNYDLAVCQNLAAANVPMPPITISRNGPRYVFGTADLTGEGIAAQVDYSGFVYELPSFSSGLAQGFQIGGAMAAAANRSSLVPDAFRVAKSA